jgi:tagaturonate reductase
MAIIGQIIGLHTVREAIDHIVLGKFMRRLIYDEIIPHIKGDINELEDYADEVINRFRNPAIDHKLESIVLNSFSKFNVRVLPSLIDDMERNGRIPERLSFIFASLLYYYRGFGEGKQFVLKDSEEIIKLMKDAWIDNDSSEFQISELCRHVMTQPIWGADLTKYPLLISRVSKQLHAIASQGILESLKRIEDR